jgi:hypothetical protein
VKGYTDEDGYSYAGVTCICSSAWGRKCSGMQ